MGYDRFSTNSYRAYSDTHRLRSASRDEVFQSRSIPQALDPAKINIRESCDSELNPSSTPIILGLDVTGSMGFVAEHIAKDGLPVLMERIYQEKPVSDPHLMFMGIGDVFSDRAPLQVSQFEAGAIPLIEQLRQMWIEGNGGGNSFESYNLPWYFAAFKTSIDSFTKRGQKGYIFTIGDELPPPELTEQQLKKVFGAGQFQSVSTHSLLNLVSERYKVFHVVAEEGSFARSWKDRVRGEWTEILGPNVIMMRDHRQLPEIIVSALNIDRGVGIDIVLSESNISKDLEYAFVNALRTNG